MSKNQIESHIFMMMKEIEKSSYFHKLQTWKGLLAKCEGDTLLHALSIFLDYFPFNYDQWIKYIELTNFDNYQLALKRNSKSFQLWDNYISYVKTTPICQDPKKFRKEVERAILEIGADTRAGKFYLIYYEMLSENYKWEFYKKIFTRALENLEQIYQMFLGWFSSLTDQQVLAIGVKEIRGRQIELNQMKIILLEQIRSTYEKTLNYRSQRMQLEKQIKHFYFNENQVETLDDQKVWRKLINLERKNNTVENISYCYERMLISQTNNVELWEEVFHYLQNETNKYTKVLNIFRFNKKFFINFDTDFYFYWCDLEERENPSEARKMYIELEENCTKKPYVYLRHIQFEIREKQWDNAKKLFDKLILDHQGNTEQIDLLCYLLIEYTNYVVKYYKDLDYPSKLLKSYFDYLPYNHYLFTNYLLFMKNFEYKEAYYDELMALILEGIKKAKEVLSADQVNNKVLKMIKTFLRSNLSSIYLIKLSQRKIMDG